MKKPPARGILLKRVYDARSPRDGRRLLVERLWPRGVSKAAAALDGWVRDAAPSSRLRRWFGHEPARWAEFRRRYRAELEAHPEVWRPILADAEKGVVTLLFSSRDAEHNNVVALRDFLLGKR
ncbi:MAG TPA: DUF488 family protein [Candidatus Didemnitutus sp.]|jgi:uncharacterized protein YeaO (DUF488 family)